MYWILIYVSLKGKVDACNSLFHCVSSNDAKFMFPSTELFLHPFTPLYHSGKIFSYKTYNVSEVSISKLSLYMYVCMYVCM